MSEAVADSGDKLAKLLEEKGLRGVALVDDVYDPLDKLEFLAGELDDLWALAEASEEALADLERIGHQVSGPEELTGEVLAAFDARRVDCPVFDTVWKASLVGGRVEGARGPLERLKGHLEDDLGLEVREFGRREPTANLVAEESQLLFLDWYLGDVGVPDAQDAGDGTEYKMPNAVKVAVSKAKEILKTWPSGRPKPLIVLMSVHPGLREQADEFCRSSGILRGMFYAVPKGELTDLFNLRMHMHLFAMSLPAGRRLQTFVNALRVKFKDTETKFLEGISDLSLNDYAYIQSLSLQEDGQPLGDYLLWLFSAYFGQLLFAEALRDERADLDTMTFSDALPSLGPPSGRLTELYHCALFDTSVGPVTAHPQATEKRDTEAPLEQPWLSLGDVFELQANQDQSASTDSAAGGKGQIAADAQARIVQKPHIFLVINPQCDLAFTPEPRDRPPDPNRSILLLSGYLRSVAEPAGEGSKPKTELYRHDGGSYRIDWDTRKVLAIPHGKFDEWRTQGPYERVARLRLPFALEVQRAFAADLTRVGTPVMPPIYQRIAATVLRPHGSDKIYETEDDLLGNEAAFLVLTRAGAGQQCVLTLPLATKLKALLDERLVALRAEAIAAGGNKDHLPEQIEALERAIANDSEWWRLQSPFSLPKKFFNDRIQVVLGKSKGDVCDTRVVAAVSLHLGGNATAE